MRRLPWLIALTITLCSIPAHAQLWSDQVPRQRVVPLKDSVEQQMSESRWRFGPFRVEPAIKLANLGYNDNIYGTETDKVDDYTATIGVGVRSIMPLGTKTFLRLDGVPEYTWYQELSERRHFGWEAGGAFLGLFNRMQIELGARTINTVTEVSSEELRPIPQQTDRFYGNIELQILERLSIFAGGETRTIEYDPEPEDEVTGVNLLDRDESAERVGIRYAFRPNVSVFGMYEQTTADFPGDETYPSNDGDAFLVGASYDRERFYLNLVGGQRSIRYEGEGNPEFDEMTGSVFLSMRVFRRSELQLTYHRKPVYSTFVSNPFFLEDRWRIGLDLPLGHRLILLASLESGTNDYQAPVGLPDGSEVIRQDDVDSWSAGLGFRLSRVAVLQVEYRTDEYTSSIPSFDRKIARLQANIVFR